MNDTHTATILYVDDEATALKYFQRALGALAPVLTATSVEEGKRVLDAHAASIAVLVSDQRMPGGHGNELLAYARERHPHVVRILTTAYSEMEQTVEAVNQGQIHRYIHKPWEIAALRMELKQALDLARLHRDHAQLLGEKMLIRQKQMVSARIGALYALCAGVAGAPPVSIGAYLGAALAAGATPAEPDWLLMDHSDLISSEAFRNTAFGDALREQYAALERRHPDGAPRLAIGALAEGFGPDLLTPGADHLLFRDGAGLAEFLVTPSAAPVSRRHALWLACLLWLGRRGATFAIGNDAGGVVCRLEAAGTPLTRPQLADWIEQF